MICFILAIEGKNKMFGRVESFPATCWGLVLYWSVLDGAEFQPCFSCLASGT